MGMPRNFTSKTIKLDKGEYTVSIGRSINWDDQKQRLTLGIESNGKQVTGPVPSITFENDQPKNDLYAECLESFLEALDLTMGQLADMADLDELGQLAGIKLRCRVEIVPPARDGGKPSVRYRFSEAKTSSYSSSTAFRRVR